MDDTIDSTPNLSDAYVYLTRQLEHTGLIPEEYGALMRNLREGGALIGVETLDIFHPSMDVDRLGDQSLTFEAFPFGK